MCILILNKDAYIDYDYDYFDYEQVGMFIFSMSNDRIFESIYFPIFLYIFILFHLKKNNKDEILHFFMGSVQTLFNGSNLVTNENNHQDGSNSNRKLNAINKLNLNSDVNGWMLKRRNNSLHGYIEEKILVACPLSQLSF